MAQWKDSCRKGLLLGLLSGLAGFGGPVRANDGGGPSFVVHVLERRQTVAILAQLYGIPVESILQANPGMVPQHLPVGARIEVPVPAQGWPSYTVVDGDTLNSVAGGCSCPVQVLLYLNRMSPYAQLAPGQVIQVPRQPGTPLLPVQLPATGLLSTPPAPPAPPMPPTPVASSAPADLASAAPPKRSPLSSLETWIEVRLPNGARAWAPRASLLVGSPSPLDPARLIEMAQRFMGAPYRWGGQTPNGVDCSGYVQQVFDLSGYHLPRLADDQYAQTIPVSPDQAQPGDLVFFSTYAPGPSHVGIFLGNGRFLHASSSHGVIEASLSEPYFSTRYLGTRRIKDWATAGVPTPAPVPAPPVPLSSAAQAGAPPPEDP